MLACLCFGSIQKDSQRNRKVFFHIFLGIHLNTVGNSSAVYWNTIAKPAADPTLPMNAVMVLDINIAVKRKHAAKLVKHNGASGNE